MLIGGHQVLFLEAKLGVEVGQRLHDDGVDVGVPAAELVQKNQPGNI